MSAIDERIVEMTFKGASFASGVKNTLSSLTALKNGLNGLKGSDRDINNLDEAGKKFSLSGMSSGISQVTHQFNLMRIAGLTVFTTLVRQGLFAGEQLLKGLTLDPLRAGLQVYETKINAIQTILANTSAAGTTLKQVTAALNQLNIYANRTVFNFGEMAKNIGTFTAAGVGLKTSVASIKGIANLAALSGSSAEQATTAMYQLSQAIAAGRVKLQDWNSVVNAGLGGKVFQNALIETARVHGVAIDEMIKKDQGFRNTLQNGWLTSKILTDTLKEFTGDLSIAQLRAMGFTARESAAIEKQSQIAVRSATQIRTITQLMQALKEEVATAWAGVFEAIIGNTHQATSTLSSLHTVAENALTSPVKNLAKVLQQFSDLGGRTVVIHAVENAFHALGAVLSTIGAAFREVFPSSGSPAAVGLLNLAKAAERFTKALTPSKQTLSELKTIFAGLFSVIKIVIDVIEALFGGLSKIGGASKQAGGGFLAFLATIARFVTNVRKAIESGTALQTFFKTLGAIVAFPIKVIEAIIGVLGHLGTSFGHATGSITPFLQKVGDLFRNLATVIGKGITSGSFSGLATLINHLLVGSILLTIKKFLSGLGKGSAGGGGFLAGIKESFESLTTTLKTMQANLKAGILQKIAIAIGLLAASLLVLSLINTKQLTQAIAAISIMFAELIGALAIITKVGVGVGIIKMEAFAVALNLLASALVVLSGAVAILAHFSLSQLAKGLGSIAILLGELTAATLLMSTDSKGLITTSIAMTGMAVALNLLAIAVGKLGKQDLGTLAKGIGSIAALLVVLGAFNAFGGEALIGTATALVVVGFALNIIAKAVATLGALSIGTLAKGVIAIAGALGVIGVAMALMTEALPGAAALLVVAASLRILAPVIESLGHMSWGEIGKSLVVLAGSLAIIAGAMILMTEALPGAAALIVVAASLAILTPILFALGHMSWGEIAKGLVALVGVFVILAAAGIVLTPLIPTLLGLGAAIALLGVGVLAAGAGIALFGVGIAALAAAVTVSGAAILGFITGVLLLIPLTFKKIGEGIVQFADAIGNGAAAITDAFVKILTAVLNGIIKIVPLAAKQFGVVMVAILGAINKHAGPVITTFSKLILTMLDKANKYVPQFVSAGSKLLVNFLNGMSKKIGNVVNAATNLIVAFINAIGNGAQRVVNAGVNMVIRLINGIANKIRASSPALHDAAGNLASAIIGGMVAGISGGIGSIISAITSMAKSALDAAKNVLGIHSPSTEFAKVGRFISEGTAQGITQSASLVTDSVNAMGNSMLDAIGQTLTEINNAVNSNLDLQPRITPVLDLTEAKKGFKDMHALSKAGLIAATASTSSATSISAANAAAAKAAGLIAAGSTNLTFNQNITSPATLSATTIYRQTRNQLSIAKGVLAKNANGG